MFQHMEQNHKKYWNRIIKAFDKTIGFMTLYFVLFVPFLKIHFPTAIMYRSAGVAIMGGSHLPSKFWDGNYFRPIVLRCQTLRANHILDLYCGRRLRKVCGGPTYPPPWPVRVRLRGCWMVGEYHWWESGRKKGLSEHTLWRIIASVYWILLNTWIKFLWIHCVW